MTVGRDIRARLLLAIVAAGLVLALPVAADAITVRVVSHGSRSEPVVALTFDDGVSPENCRRILAILVAQHVPATFFPIAEAMSLDPAFWRLVSEAGYPVGDHSWSHPQLPTLSEAAQLAQIEKGRTAAEAILGRPIIPVVRPPYGAYDADTVTAAGQAGFGTLLLWDASDRDTSQHGTVAQMLVAGEAGTNGSVVLMHCGPNATPYLLSDLIASYRSRGFRFVTIPQLLGIPWDPGRTSAIAPATILGGLSPLPSTPTGGPITGPSGYEGPSPAPGPSLGPTPRPSPSPSRGASPMPSPSPSASPSPHPRPSSPGATSSAAPGTSPSVALSPPPAAGGGQGAGSDGSSSAIPALGVLGLSVLALGSVVEVARRRTARPTR